MSAIFFLLPMLPLISAQHSRWGLCCTPHVKSNFNLPLYMGKWYEIEKIPAYFTPGKCLVVNYALVKHNTIHVRHHRTFGGKVIEGGCTAKVLAQNEPAKLGISFSHHRHYHPYWVLDTDYINYAIVYSCNTILNLYSNHYAWIIGRKCSLPPETIHKAKELLKKEGISVRKMVATDQSCGNH